MSRRQCYIGRLLRHLSRGSMTRKDPASSTGRRRAGPSAPIRTLIYFSEVDKGGHFAAREQPELFSAEFRASFRPLRT
jgi:hypothetical protein